MREKRFVLVVSLVLTITILVISIFAEGWWQFLMFALLGDFFFAFIITLVNYLNIRKSTLLNIIERNMTCKKNARKEFYSIKDIPTVNDLYNVVTAYYNFSITPQIHLFIKGLFFFQSKIKQDMEQVLSKIEKQNNFFYEIICLIEAKHTVSEIHIEQLLAKIETFLESYAIFDLLASIAKRLKVKTTSISTSEAIDSFRKVQVEDLLAKLID